MQFVKTFIWNEEEQVYFQEYRAMNVNDIKYIEIESISGKCYVKCFNASAVVYQKLYRCDISDDKQHYIDEDTFNRLVG